MQPYALGPYALAASVSVAGLLAGPRRRIEVAAVTARAVYLATDDPEHPALCVAGPRAVRVPCALVANRLPGPVAIGEVGAVGAGGVSLGSFEGRVARWWRPPRPRALVADELRTVAGELGHRLPALPDPDAAVAVDDLVRTLAAGAPPTADVMRLLGRGPGLTPVCDDVLAGLLVTLGALGSPAVGPLADAVRALAPTRTTFVSAALLRHAAGGECVPQLAAVLTAGRDGSPLPGAVDALLDVGHTSGAGLGHGVLAALSTALREPAGGRR